MVTESRWLQLAPDVEETVNGGQAFGPYQSDFHGTAPRVVFADARVGYAADGDGLQRTVDGGAHWVRISLSGTPVASPSPTSSPIAMPSDVHLSVPSKPIVWALENGSLLFLSEDEGNTWQQRALPPPLAGGATVEISFVDATYGWAATCPGGTTTIWRTTDGARSWVTLDTTPDTAGVCLRALSFVDRTHGFVSASPVDAKPTVYRTADGGATWSSSTLPDPPGFQTAPGFALNAHAVVQLGTTDYVTAYGLQPDGGKAYVFKSTDGGGSWVFAADVPNISVSVAFVTASRWLQVIAPGQSVETTDAGKSWHAYVSDYSQAAPVTPQVVFADSSVGYATVRGEIQRTTDGGAHWTRIKTPGT
jgi:photosystem II stability/assembly factor-like uncharacterized protein